MPGELKKATKNRVSVLLVAVIGRPMIMGCERSEERALQASRKRKREFGPIGEASTQRNLWKL